jgi:hypothetical protein
MDSWTGTNSANITLYGVLCIDSTDSRSKGGATSNNRLTAPSGLAQPYPLYS